MRYQVEILERRTMYHGFLHLVRYRLRHSLYLGGRSEELVRERLEGLRAAAVLLYDPSVDCIVLVEQFRAGLLHGERGAWTLEPVGGVVAPGEDPAVTVRKEALEEAGCEIEALEIVGEFYVSPGYSDDRVALFCGSVRAEGAQGVFGLPEEGEDIRTVMIDLEQAQAELFTGRINTTTAIIAVQWLATNRQRLRAQWRRA